MVVPRLGVGADGFVVAVGIRPARELLAYIVLGQKLRGLLEMAWKRQFDRELAGYVPLGPSQTGTGASGPVPV